MVNNKDLENGIFIGADGISIGGYHIDSENYLWFKALGEIGKKPLGIGRMSPDKQFSYVIMPEYSRRDNKLTGDNWKVFFFDLKKYSKFNFQENVPQEVMIKYQVLETENNLLKQQIEKLLNLIEASSINDLNKKMLINEMELSRKLVFNNSGMNFNNSIQDKK